MEKSYRFLLVEDDLADAELIMHEIKKHLFNPVFKRVDNKSDYLKILESYKPDIILSDYSMPVFDGLKALAIAKEKCPFTPFIVVTGSVNEDTAVGCMKAGASDYVLKDSLKRLVPSIITSIEQQNLRKQRVNSEKKLMESEQSYLGLFNSISEAIYILNSQGEFVAVNQGTEKMYGFAGENLIGQTHAFLAAPGLNNLQEISETLNHIFRTGVSQQFDFWGKHNNGKIFPSEVIGNKGNYFGEQVIIATARDITEQNGAVENLRNERKLLRTVIDNLPVTIYVKDAECRKIIANRTDLEVVGVNSESEVYGKTDLETFSNETGRRGYYDDKQVIESGKAILNREEDFVDPNGNSKWLLTSKIPLSDENGRITGLVGIGRDITEQRLAQENILKLSKSIEQSPTSIEITDSKGIVEYVNPRFCELTGFSPEDVVGQQARIFHPGEIEGEMFNDFQMKISSGEIWEGEIFTFKNDGTKFWELVIIAPIKNEKDQITNYTIIKEDITERKKLQSELVRAKEKAEESDRLKSAFLANISHEIRTPLNSIIGFSELLNDPDFDEQQKNDFIRTIVENGNSLLVIISDIMDFSMLEAQQIKVRKDVFSAKELLEDLISDFGKKANQKGLEMRIELTDDTPDIKIESDLYRIKQIFTNLINNSLKFTNTGYIEIGYRVANETIEFREKDTGIGIDQQFHQIIFERFRQVDTAKTRKFGGNGLGLAISKNLAELLGGKIWVESEPGKFSEFFFSIPLKSN